MSGNDLPEGVAVTPDDWIVSDLELFQFFRDHPPPRPYGYLRQLKIDTFAWRPVALWAASALCVILGIIGRQWFSDSWLLIILGVALFFIWFRFFRNAVQYFRDSPVLAGVIAALEPHPTRRDMCTARATLANGQEVGVVFLSKLPASAILKEHGRAEVLLLYDPASMYSWAIGIRPQLPNRSSCLGVET